MQTGKTTHLFVLILLLITVSLRAITSETDIHSSNSKPSQPVIYRGFTVCELSMETLKEARETWHANQVRYMICPIWRQRGLGAQTLQEAWQKILAKLPEGLDNAQKVGINVIIDLHQIPNDHPQTYTGTEHEQSHAWWLDQSNLETLLACWRDLAKQAAQRPNQSLWLEIYNEPLDWPYVHQHPCYPPEWPKWAQAAIDEIRKIDTVHPIVIATGPGMLCWGFKDFPPLKDPSMDIIYSLHMYQPIEYTHQGVNGQEINAWSKENSEAYMTQEMQAAIDFQKKYKVRMHVGEFSAARWAPNAEVYLRDCIEFFEKMGWDWNYHALHEAGVWSLEESEQCDLLDPNGVYVKTDIAQANKNLKYRKYGEPMTGELKKPEGFTKRGQVLLDYLKRNDTIKETNK